MSISTINLRQATYDQQMPFMVEIDGKPLICQELLRIVPKRRLVCKATLDGKTVIAKLFVDPVNAVRQVNRETQGLAALEKAQLPAPKNLGTYILPGGGRALITEFLENATSPLDALKTANENSKIQLIKQMFELLSKFHQSGLAQRDLHLNNFLIQGNKFFAIDAADIVSYSRPLSVTQAKVNLGVFYSQFTPDTLPLVAQALSGYNFKPACDRLTHEILCKEGLAFHNRKWRHFKKKIFRTCTDIIVKKSLTKTIRCKRKLYTPAMQELLANPDLAIEQGNIISQSSSSTVAIVKVDDHRIVIKKFNPGSLAMRINRLLLPNFARRSWYYSHLLIFSRIPTPTPIATVEPSSNLIPGPSYFIADFIDLPTVKIALQSDESCQHSLVTELANLLATLKQIHVTHGNFQLENFLYSPAKIYITDLKAMSDHCYWGVVHHGLFFAAHHKDKTAFIRQFQGSNKLSTIALNALNNTLA